MATTLWDLLRAERWADASKRLASHPGECKEKSPNGWGLPLHQCCLKAAPAEVTKAVLKAFPGAVCEKTNDGWLALHLCCRFAAPAEVTSAVRKVFPGAVSEETNDGWLALHLCCRYAAPAEATVAVLKAFPWAASRKTPQGFLPLHFCCQNAVPAEATVAVLQAFPGAAREYTPDNWLPLQLCCRYAGRAEAAKEVLNAFPEAAREKNWMGTLPIDDALASLAAPEFMSALLQAHPIWTGRMQGMLQDPKTGLPNAAAQDFTLETLEAECVVTEDSETALIEIDLRNFKKVNDEVSHAEGDKALFAFAKQLRQWEKAYPHARAFRTGGDEFAVVLQEASSGTCKAILQDITAYHRVHGGVVVSARAVAVSQQGGYDYDEKNDWPRWDGKAAREWLKAVEKVLHEEDHPDKLDRTVLGYPEKPSPKYRPAFWKELDKSGNAQVWCGNPPEGKRAELEQKRSKVPKLNGWKYLGI